MLPSAQPERRYERTLPSGGRTGFAVHAALAAGELDHHKARVFTDYLSDVTPAQADRICERLVPVAPGRTTGQLAARLLREVQAIDPEYTRRTYQRAVHERAVHGYLDHTGTAVLTGSGLPAADAAAAAARLEVLADDLRATGYPAAVGKARADLFLRLLDGTLDGLSRRRSWPPCCAWALSQLPRVIPTPSPPNSTTGTANPRSVKIPSNLRRLWTPTNLSAPSNPVRAVPERRRRVAR